MRKESDKNPSAPLLGRFGLPGPGFLDAFGCDLFHDLLFDFFGFGLLLVRCCIAHNESLDGLHECLFCHDVLLDVKLPQYKAVRSQGIGLSSHANISATREVSSASGTALLPKRSLM